MKFEDLESRDPHKIQTFAVPENQIEIGSHYATLCQKNPNSTLYQKQKEYTVNLDYKSVEFKQMNEKKNNERMILKNLKKPGC
jgi:hypothetical protein